MNKTSDSTILGTVALVTGGTRGIGRAIAQRLLEEGARVAICGTKQETVDAAVTALSPLGDVYGLVADVSNRDDVKKMISAVSTRYGGIHTLVNSAGLGLFGAVTRLEPADFERMIAVNLLGAYYCAYYVLPIFEMYGKGDVVNVSSLAGSNAFAGGAGYNASKFGLNGFSDAMMQDYRDKGIRVAIVAPGSVDTEFGGRQATGASREFGGRIAPEDVADIIAMVLKMPRRTTVSRVEIRPSLPPRK